MIISIRRPATVTKLRGEPTFWEFKDSLEAGKTYQVVIKTVAGKVTSWPATGNVTLSEFIYVLCSLNKTFKIDRKKKQGFYILINLRMTRVYSVLLELFKRIYLK